MVPFKLIYVVNDIMSLSLSGLSLIDSIIESNELKWLLE